jgi:hypothetical protein
VSGAVVSRLTEVGVGDRVLVDRADGTTAEFVTHRAEQHDKGSFPTDDVYGRTFDAQLRPITCGGAFSREDPHLDNVIVYAT